MSVITGTIKTPDNHPYTGELRFRALSTPVADAPDLIVAEDEVVSCTAAGTFTVTLRTGQYRVWVGRESLTIAVPDDNASYDILELIDGDISFTASPSTSGFYRADTLTALRTVASAAGNKIAWLLGETAAWDIAPPRVYAWDAASMDADDGLLYVRPSDFTTAGLWRQIL